MILLDRITKTYPGDEEPALDNVSLHIEPHEFVFLVGKSGAGKSTLIKMITKEEQPDSGKIVIGGIDLDYVKKRHIPHYRRRLGVVFQDYKLLPTRTVFENVSFALEIAGMSSREINRTVPKVLDLVGLADKAHKFPTHLSGGEQQRVSIARSVARQPKILIADEPTGNLDKLTRQEIIDLLQRINDFGTTVLVTTHDEGIVNDLGKRVVTLKGGRIVADQKVHGVYRLDGLSENDRMGMGGLVVPTEKNEPAMEPPMHIQVPGEKLVGYQGAIRVANSKTPTEASMKIQHPSRRKPVTSPAKRVATTRNSTAKVGTRTTGTRTAASTTKTIANTRTGASKTANISAPKTTSAAAPKPASRPTRKLAQDSANQWYTASRPLKAAPKLSDFSLGQTVKLKPAPSMSQIAHQRPVVPKVRQKRVIQLRYI